MMKDESSRWYLHGSVRNVNKAFVIELVQIQQTALKTGTKMSTLNYLPGNTEEGQAQPNQPAL
jgi:hypothetical protein